MRVVICGGGTAGHVTPGIALADFIKDKDKSAEIIFFGREGGEENELTKKSGYECITLDVTGFKRTLTPKNLSTAFKLLIAYKRARKFLKNFRPDVVIGTGGYVTWPIIKAAEHLRIPSVIHESNAYPGLTTRMLAKGCDKIFLNFAECKKHLKRQDNAIVVGNPIRAEFSACTREAARKRLKINPWEIFVLSFGGSGGAKIMNESILQLMRTYSKENPGIRHIHATGRKYFQEVKADFPDLVSESDGCVAVPFIEDMPTYMLASDIIISRAGAMTLSETAKAGAASIIIPSPNVTDNHQFKNAMAYANSGAATVIEEKELTQNKLKNALDKLVKDKKMRESFRRSAHSLYVPNSAEKIYREIKILIDKRRKN